MSVEFWIGREFDYTPERRAQDEIVRTFRANFTSPSEAVVVIFNFSFPGADIDVLVLKPDAILIIDLKDCDKPIKATENGPWKIIPDGNLPGQRNPFQQVKAYRYALMEFLSRRKSSFLQPQKASLADFEHIAAAVVMTPSLHPKSTSDIKYPFFHLAGADKLHLLVRQLTEKAFSFRTEELRSLAQHVFNCQPLEMKPPSVTAAATSHSRPEPGSPVPTVPPLRPNLQAPPAPLVSRTEAQTGTAGKLIPADAGIQRGVKLFRYFAEQANRGKAVGIPYGSFIAFLHGKETFKEVAGRNYLPSDGGHVIDVARKITDAARGRIDVGKHPHSIKSGMDTFIWNQKEPYNRPDRAFQNPKYVLPYTQEQWSSFFPNGERRLVTGHELSSL